MNITGTSPSAAQQDRNWSRSSLNVLYARLQDVFHVPGRFPADLRLSQFSCPRCGFNLSDGSNRRKQSQLFVSQIRAAFLRAGQPVSPAVATAALKPRLLLAPQASRSAVWFCFEIRGWFGESAGFGGCVAARQEKGQNRPSCPACC